MGRIIYHIAIDEKFINAAQYQFQKATNTPNEFYIIHPKDKPLKHVTISEQVHILANKKTEKTQLCQTITEQDLVVFHSLNSKFYDIVLQLPKATKTIWMCFGFEVYNDKRYFTQQQTYAPKTLERIIPKISENRQTSFSGYVKRMLKGVIRFFHKDYKLTKPEKKRKAIQRIDYLGTSFQEEFDMITKRIRLQKKLFEYWYYPLEKIVATTVVMNSAKEHILVGNSGFPTLNHLDVFERLAKIPNIKQASLIVPLNYGNDDYIATLKAKGEELLGDAFKPLDTFLPLEEYNKILQNVAVAIFYNYRQQALGNIIALLYMGAKVYLSKQNPIYHFFKRHQVKIYSFDTDFDENMLTALDLEDRVCNKKIMSQLLQEKQLLLLLREQLDAILV